MKMRIRVLLVLVLAASMIFSACTASTTTTAAGTTTTTAAGTTTTAAPEKITLRMIDSLASEVRTAAIQKILDDYTAANPNVTIELISPPTEGADQKIQQMLLAKEQLDLIDTGNSFQLCINNGWVQPLNNYLADWDEMSTITAAAVSRMTVLAEDGKSIWCVPYGIYQQLLFYRTDLFTAANVQPPTTWQEVYETGKKLTDKTKGQYGWAFRGGTRGCFVYDYMMLGYFDAATLNADERYRAFLQDGTCVYRTPEALEALEFYKSIFTDTSPADSISWGFTEMVQGFMSGTCAMLLQDNDVIQSCRDGLDPAVWNATIVPHGPSGIGTQSAGYGGWAMTSYTEYPEQAADLLMFLSNADNNGYFCEKTGLLPIHTTTLENNEFFKIGAYEVFNKMDEISDTYRIFTGHGVGYDCSATFPNDRDTNLQKYLLGQIDGQDLLDSWAKTWEDAVTAQGQLWNK